MSLRCARGRSVIPPWRNNVRLRCFFREIRVCFSLVHPTPCWPGIKTVPQGYEIWTMRAVRQNTADACPARGLNLIVAVFRIHRPQINMMGAGINIPEQEF